ncbi:MAG: leucine-rich repeat protein, partial [Clostridia bacterium]|nr:leucine-rich repeat protein [Clostridia bacterium]
MKKKILSALLAMCLVVAMLPMDALASVLSGTSFGNSKVISSKEYAIAPGITESDIVLNDDSGTNQNKGFVMEIDVSNPDVTLKAGYKNYDATSWGMQNCLDQAAAAEKTLKKADENANVVGVVNANFFNMATGEPIGALVMNGTVYHNTQNGYGYFAILNDGTAEIRSGNTPLGDNVVEAMGGREILVEDGKNIVADTSDVSVNPRTAVGIKSDGTVVLFVDDGRQSPTSIGMTIYEVADAMIGLGCVTALNLDGGGSSTFATEREGSGELTIKNSPSDGAAREVSGSLLVVSSAKPSGVFDHAALSPNSELYTPGSQVQFEAQGVDSTGAAVDIPEGVTWTLADGSSGSIDAETGLYTADSKTGTVTAQLMLDGAVVGSTSIEIVEPDQIYFSSEEISLGFEETTDFGLVVRNQGRDINYKEGDIVWSITDPNMGTFDGNLFTSADGASLNGDVTAVSAYDASISGSIHVIVGMLPTVVMDFEDYTDPETGEVTPAKEYYTIGNSQTDGSKYYTSNYNRGGKQSAEIVSIDDDEPVRFGSHSLKLNYDFTACGAVTEGACFGTSESMSVPGSPTGIGVWVYAPEGTGIVWEGDGTQAGFWLRGYVRDGSGTNLAYDFTLEPKQVTGDQQPGIYWEGWKYLEADLTKYQGPFSIQPGMTFRLMYVAGTQMGTKSAGSIYFDNLQFVYGANVDDVDSPVIDSIMANNAELTNGAVLNTNTVTFDASFHDVENKYTTGIDTSTIRMYIDGINVTDNDDYTYVADPDGSKNHLYDVNLLNGQHSITVSMRDGFGNETTETRYFTVSGEEQNVPTISVKPLQDSAVLGETVQLEIRASNKSVDYNMTSLKLDSKFRDYMIEFSDSYEGTSSYNKLTDTLTLEATRKTGLFQFVNDLIATDDLIATVTIQVPNTLREGDVFAYTVKAGSYKVDDNTYTYSAPEVSLPVAATYLVTADPIVVGTTGIIKVTAADGTLAANIGVYLEDGTAVGTTAEDGTLETDMFSQTAGKYVVYARDDEDRISFYCNVASYDAKGDETGAPYAIMNNAVSDPTTQKSISWMSNPKSGEQKVQYAKDGSDSWKDAAAQTQIRTFTKGGNSAAAVNSVILKNLAPGTTYRYRVGSDDQWSDEMTFTTTVADDDTKFFVLSDIQADDLTNITALMNNIKSENFTFGIQTGDAVDDATSYEDWNDVVTLFGTANLGDTDMIHVLGNHEYAGDANADTSAAVYNLPASAPGSYYSTTYGNVYVAVINYSSTAGQLKEALEWIKEDASKSDADWKVLTMHQPSYYTNISGGNAEINRLVPPVVDEVGFDFVFSGHDHSYARTEPLTGGAVDQENGTVYYIGGTSGEKSYYITDNADFHFVKATQDFNAIYMSVDATQTDITVTTYNVASDGTKEVFDSYTKKKPLCANDDHAYLYNRSTDTLTCSKCGYTTQAKESMYAGFANEEETGKLMYFISGKYQTGYYYVNSTPYYFDKDGCGYEGEYTILGETCTFEQGQFVSCSTADVMEAGICNDDLQFVLYADGSLYINGTGTMKSAKPADLPWHKYRAKITAVTLGADLTNISDYAFYDCDGISKITFEEGSKMQEIGGAVFYSCARITDVTLPDGVTTIYGNAFAKCDRLKSVYIPDAVSKISAGTFSKSPNVVLSVGYDSYAKAYAKAYSIAYVERSIQQLDSGEFGDGLTWTLMSDGSLTISGNGAMPNYKNAYDVPWSTYSGMIKNMTIGAGITNLSDYAFYYCTSLTTVTFEEGSKLQTIGGSVFYRCTSLRSIEIPEGVTTIYGNSFAKCTSLVSVYLPDSMSSISVGVFDGSSNVTLSVGYDSYAKAYAEKYGIDYTERTIQEVASGEFGDGLTWTLMSDGSLTISGSGAMPNYKNAYDVPWSTYSGVIKHVTIGAGITNLSDYAFYYCKALETVTFEEG